MNEKNSVSYFADNLLLVKSNSCEQYVVRVSAGIDYTVMAALTVAYDDYRSESGKSTL